MTITNVHVTQSIVRNHFIQTKHLVLVFHTACVESASVHCCLSYHTAKSVTEATYIRGKM